MDRKYMIWILGIIFVFAGINTTPGIPTGDAAPDHPDDEYTVNIGLYFEKPEIDTKIIEKTSYNLLQIPGLTQYGNPGEPALPVKTVNILLPPGGKLRDIHLRGNPQFFGSGYHIEPRRVTTPLTKSSSSPVEPYHKSEIYDSYRPYPMDAYRVQGIHHYRGYAILTVNIYPVFYVPETEDIYWYNHLTMDIISTQDSSTNTLLRDEPYDQKRVLDRIENPEMISVYEESATHMTQGLCDSNETYEYVIITSNTFASYTGDYSFAVLRDSKIAKGVPATIVTVEDIINETEYWNITSPIFNDTQAKIRNFITDAYLNWGTEYVLLGGDGDSNSDCIPPRKLYATASGNPAGEDEAAHIPADCYYACLDGNWNSDEDDRWGESPGGNDQGIDEADLYAEVYIGRACIDSFDELENFVMKTVAYEDSNEMYLQKTLMVGEFLDFGGVADWAGNYKDEMINGSTAHGYTTLGIPGDRFIIDTLYDRDWPNQNWPVSEIVTRINEGTHLLNHLGHGNIHYALKMTSWEVGSALTNSEYCFIYSQTCLAGHFDETDCIAEAFTAGNPTGAFAVIMNARYGYGTVGSTDGPSQRYDREFWDAVFREDIPQLGRANQDSKEDNNYRISESCMRWCWYELNLFGDPELSFHEFYQDAEPPEISDVLASPNPQEINQWVNITCTVTDNYQVDTVKINITGPPPFIPLNTTMTPSSHYYNTTYTTPGTYTYYIWANDTTGHTNTTPHHTFIIQDMMPPDIQDVLASPNPQEINQWVNITCTVTDNYQVDTVKINITGPPPFIPLNTTMTPSSHYYNTTYTTPGTYTYYIWANDTTGHTNTTPHHTFIIQDNSPPTITEIHCLPNPQLVGEWINITSNVQDNYQVDTVKINITGPPPFIPLNTTMTPSSHYYNTTYTTPGTYTYYIWANDTQGNTNTSPLQTFLVITEDIYPPKFDTITVSHAVLPEDTDEDPQVYDNTTACNEMTNISVELSDLTGIANVTIDLQHLGHALCQMTRINGTQTWYIMTNATVGTVNWNGVIYEPYSIPINATDNGGNWNRTTVEITVWKNGDVSGNGKVTLYDATYTARWYLGIIGENEIHQNIADVSGDGIITLYDCTYLARGYLGISGYEIYK